VKTKRTALTWENTRARSHECGAKAGNAARMSAALKRALQRQCTVTVTSRDVNNCPSLAVARKT